MKPILLLLTLLFSFNAMASVGKITALKGYATFERNQKQIPIALGATVKERDIIHTGADSRLQIVFNDKTVVTLGKNTQFSVNNYLFDGTAHSNAEFSLIKGFFKAMTGEMGKLVPNRFKVQTKTATIGIRGTVYTLEVSNYRTRLTTLSGATYYEDHTTNTRYEVPKNHQLTHVILTKAIEIKSLKDNTVTPASAHSPQATSRVPSEFFEMAIPIETSTSGALTEGTTSYSSYGYNVDPETGTLINVWADGSPATDPAIIDSAISSSATAAYSGNLIVFDENSLKGSGAISINVDFGGGSSAVNGNLDYQVGSTPWKASYTGSVTNSGITATSFSDTAGTGVQGINGVLSGQFYGPNAEDISGVFSLSGLRNTDSSNTTSTGSYNATGTGP